MSEININYKGSKIAGMDASGTKTLLTEGKYCEDDIEVVYTKPAAPTPSLQSKTYNVSSAGTETITADSGYDGLSSVQVSVPTFNGAIDIDAGGFSTVSNQRKWKVRGWVSADIGEDGYIGEGNEYGEYTYYNAVPSGTTVTPTTSSQTIGGDNYMMEDAVTVAAMPSGTAGTPTATKGSVSNHSISVTPSVTNTTGYITGSTKTGTAVTVSASELVSGTYTVDSSGTKDVTNYASASVPAGTAGTPSASKGAVSNHSVSVTPSVTNTTGWITGSTKTGTAVTVSASELVSGNLPITQNGNNIDCANYSTVSVNVSGGGGSSMQIDTIVPPSSITSSTMTFTGLSGEPTSFMVYADDVISTSASPKVAAVVFDGTSLHGQIVTNTSNAQASYDTGFTKSYSNGTLTITSTNASFISIEHYLTYTYGGGAVDTKDVQVGSGATSITFTGLEDEPVLWSCIFKSNFSTSSGYQRVMAVGETANETIVGFAMDSSAHVDSAYWTASYNNGSFTISSRGTNAGGYFHQPGYYQLTYAYDDGSGGNYQSKTVTPTTSQQVVQADSGYDALKKVTVNAIPSEYIVPSGNISITSNTATGQTLNVAQYATATVAVPTGGANIATATMTNSSNQNTTISFTLPSGRTPKAFFARLTSQIARNSNSRYYYVFDMRWDGSSTGGVAGNTFYMYNGTLTNVTSGYSYSQSGTTFTLSSTGSRSASPGSFYNGDYELVYIY